MPSGCILNQHGDVTISSTKEEITVLGDLQFVRTRFINNDRFHMIDSNSHAPHRNPLLIHSDDS